MLSFNILTGYLLVDSLDFSANSCFYFFKFFLFLAFFVS